MKANIYVKRRKALAEQLEDKSMMILFSGEAPRRSADQLYEYTPERSFYYLTGIDRPNMILLMTKENDDVGEILFIEKGNETLEKWIGKRMSKEEAKKCCAIDDIAYDEDFYSRLGSLLIRKELTQLYLNIERHSKDEADTKSITFAEEIRKKYPHLFIKNCYPMISRMRTIKDEAEVENIKKAIEITRLGIEALMENAKPDMMEYQLETYYDQTIKYNGVKSKAFQTIAAAGHNATVLHYESNDTKINDRDLILFDLGCEWEYYCSDISRTFPINGKFTDRQKELYNIVLKVEEAAIAYVKPGITWNELNQYAKDLLIKECKAIGLIEEDSEIAEYYYHGIGHYLGLDTHDVGYRDQVLEPGMVITIEPGLYISEENIGIRIEDDILVTEDGYENLSSNIIKTVNEIEGFMTKN